MKPIIKLVTLVWLYSLLLIGAQDQAFAKKPVEFDCVNLESGARVKGYIISETRHSIHVETVGGTVIIPPSSVKDIVRAQPGESAILLGLNLLDRKQLNRAEKFLRKASTYSTWKNESESAIRELLRIRKEEYQKKKELEERQIERIVQQRGIQAGINELQRRYSTDDEYWGSYRGRLHLLMARERIDHLHISEAERHLALAEKYNVNPEEWNKVRDELVELKRRWIRYGSDTLANLPRKTIQKPVSKGSTQFLQKVQIAQRKGEELPPMELIRHVDYYAEKNDIDPLLVWAVIDVESSWKTTAVSHTGDQGLMQLAPMTAKDLDVEDPFDPEENIRGGTQFLSYLLRTFKDTDTAIAAYNVGPGRVGRTGIPPAGHRYIKLVRKRYALLQKRFNQS